MTCRWQDPSQSRTLLQGVRIASDELKHDGSAQIGRMAVLAQFRKQGIGSKVLTTLIEYGKSLGAFKFILHSQLTAIPFYEKQGFIANGPIYDEAGIAHRNMILLISATD